MPATLVPTAGRARAIPRAEHQPHHQRKEPVPQGLGAYRAFGYTAFSPTVAVKLLPTTFIGEVRSEDTSPTVLTT